MTRSSSETNNKINRRNLLKAAAAGGAFAATQGIGGFPTVWAQNTKDVTLVHAGGSYAAIKEIGDQASKELGFKIVMQAITDDVQLQPLADPADHHRHQQHRQHQAAVSPGQGGGRADPGGEVQALG